MTDDHPQSIQSYEVIALRYLQLCPRYVIYGKAATICNRQTRRGSKTVFVTRAEAFDNSLTIDMMQEQ